MYIEMRQPLSARSPEQKQNTQQVRGELASIHQAQDIRSSYRDAVPRNGLGARKLIGNLCAGGTVLYRPAEA
ncbi:unnamed protein product, partial [Iphiclides podalirius]